MYGWSNKKDIEEQFARHERRCTLLRRQLEVDEWVDVGLREIDTSPTLHHSMTSQVQKDNIFSLPLFLADHVRDLAIKVSGYCIPPAHTYKAPSQISCRA